jgi:hypothetical protein
MTAPVASGWSGCRVGLAPTGKAPPYHGARQKQTLIGVRDIALTAAKITLDAMIAGPSRR